MAIRSRSSSLRRHFAWTLVTVASIGIVSVVSMAIYRHSKKAEVAPEVAVQPAAANGDSAGKITEQTAAASTDVRGTISGAKLAGDFHSAKFGYKISLDGLPWTRWEDLAQVLPEAEWGALLDGYGRFLIVPVVLGELDPRPEALDHALLARLGIAYPSDQLSDFQSIDRQGVAGHAFQLTRDVSGAENDYRIWVLRRGELAYLVAAWMDRSVPAAAGVDVSVLSEAMNRLSFDVDASTPPIAEALNTAQRQAHGNIYNDLGLADFNSRDFSSAIDCFRSAFQLQPNDPAILTNLLNAHIELKQFQQALAELEPHLNRFPNQPDLWAGRAYLLAELGQTDAAATAYANLFASGYFAEAPFTQYVSLLAENDRGDEAIAAIDRSLQQRDSFALRRLQASLFRQRGENERALAILTRLAQNRPFNAELAYDLAETSLAMNRQPEALEICRELIEHRYDTAHTYLLEARALYANKWYAQAKTALEAALKREPTNKDAQDLLQVVGNMLGEGNNASIQEPIDPVELPKQLTDQSKWTESDKSAPTGLHEFGAFYTAHKVAIKFEPGKEFKQSDYRTIRIADASGIERFGTIQIPFDPLAEQVYVNRLRVTDAKGEEVTLGKVSDFYVIDGARADIPTNGKVLNIPVPGLQTGSTIELLVTRRDLVPPNEFPYIAHVFSSEVPVVSAALYVAAERSSIHFDATTDVHQEDVDGGLAWSIAYPQVFRREPLQPSRATFLPRITLCSSETTWEQLAKGYLVSIADRTIPDASVEALAKQLTDGLADDEARTIKLVQYVQDRLNYKAVEFGRHARVPTAAAAVMKAKYGDCKDHSLLLIELLQACGIKADFALANLDAPIDPKLPSLDQFNHMLVYVPGFRGGKFFDCTDKDSDLIGIDCPLDLGGAKALVLDAANPRLIDLPQYGPSSSRIKADRHVTVVNNVDAAVDETVIVTGYHASFLRGMFRGVAVADRATTLQKELAPMGGAIQVQSLKIENLEDRDKPLIFNASYLVRGRFQPADRSLVGQVPALWEQMYLDVPPVPKRRTPFEIEYPLDFASTVEFSAPEGFAIADLTPLNRGGQTPYCNWKVSATAKRDRLKIDYELHLQSGQYQTSQYSEYGEELSHAIAALSQNVVLKRAK